MAEKYKIKLFFLIVQYRIKSNLYFEPFFSLNQLNANIKITEQMQFIIILLTY